jgi:chromate reductase
MNKSIGIFVGSLRKNSYSRKIAAETADMLPQGFDAKIIELGDLAMYNQDLDDNGNPPKAWTDFRSAVKLVDAVLFVTPEYNRSIPAVLKNALDIGSRPYGQNVWEGKPGAVISVSPGKTGGFGANHVLRQAVVFLNILMMQQPEAYVGSVSDALDENGHITDTRTREFLQVFAGAFGDWINRVIK